MPQLIRFPDWDHRLDEYLKAAAKRPFSWGEHDCILFCLGGAMAMTGVDADEGIRGTYKSAAGAARRMRVLFRASTMDEAASGFAVAWNGEEVSPLMAQRGDAVLADVPAPALGLVALDGRTALFLQAAGLTRIPLRQCRRAWRVG